MKRLLIGLVAFALAAGLLSESAEARGRLGGGRSVGVQRQAVTPQRQATPPSQAQSAPQPAGAARPWFGALAGLAAGLGLGWLFGQGGFGPFLGTLVLALGAGFLIMMLLRVLAGARPKSRPMQYAGIGEETDPAPPPSQNPLPDARAQPDNHGFRPNIPAGFDVEGFLRQARRNFLALQDANDRGDLESLRAVTTEPMFEALKNDIDKRGSEKQQTDIVTLQAALLEVATEGATHWTSVRFCGTIREDERALASPFEETWHLEKPVDGSSGWLLAGIQQAA